MSRDIFRNAGESGPEVTAREGLLPRDFKYTMQSARGRYRAERKAGTNNGLSFRGWARRTYNAKGAHGKLRDIVGAVSR